MHSSLRRLIFTLGLLVGLAVVSSGCYYTAPGVGVGVYGGGPVVYRGYYHRHRGYWGGVPYYGGYHGYHY